MKINLKKLVGKYTKDNQINWDEVQKEYDTESNTQLNNIIAKNKPDMDKIKSDMKNDVINEFVKELGFKDVENQDQLKALKDSLFKDIGDKDTEIARLTREANELKAIETKYNELNAEKTLNDQKAYLKDLKFDDKKINDAMTLIKSRVNDENDFHSIADKFSKDPNYEYLLNLNDNEGSNDNSGFGDDDRGNPTNVDSQWNALMGK